MAKERSVVRHVVIHLDNPEYSLHLNILKLLISAKSLLLYVSVIYSRFWGAHLSRLMGGGHTVSLILVSVSLTFLLHFCFPIYLLGFDHGSIDLSPGHNLSLFLPLYQLSTSYFSIYHSSMARIFQLITASPLSHLSNKLTFKFNLSFSCPLSMMNYLSTI